jgi:KDO2-lipid IV(A) lauroyltransferase
MGALGAGATLYRVGPARSLGAALAFIVGDVLGVRRAHVVASMERAAVAHPRRAARAMYRALGRGLFELIGVGLGGRLGTVHVPDDVFVRLRAGGRGCVVATAHTGNWDVVACAVAARVPLTVVTKHFKVGVLDALWQRLRSVRGVRLVASGSASRVVLRALARGELVAMLVDQAPERTRAVTEAPFLGALALVDLAPALAALRARAPLAAVFPVRLPDGTHSVHVARLFAPPERPSRSWAVEVMVEVTRLLDVHVREHPEQWLWMHRRWKGVALAAGCETALPAAGERALAGEGPSG